MSDEARQVLTIGHSTHSLEAFVALLRKHEVTALADVRSAPFSRFNPQFNKDALERSLKAAGIKYVFLGRELGARSDDPSCYENGRVQYARLAKSERFHSGLERVMKGSQEHRIALVCAEKDPLECHRTLLVARALDERGVAVSHILADGRLESQGDAMLRLLDVLGLPRDDMFRSREEVMAEALARQEGRVAYVDEKLSAESAGDVP
jgi:uncharacterized protein (DUF488 family)